MTRLLRLSLVGFLTMTALNLNPLTAMAATCQDPLGDLDGNGSTDIVDVQCNLLVSLAELAAEEEPPDCLVVATPFADLDCDQTVSVVDVQMIISLAIGNGLTFEIDTDQNGCHDACDTQECITAVKDCDDENPCTAEGCADGDCVVFPIQGECDDGDLCTENDACDDGDCVGEDKECDDGVECTDDACDPNSGNCVSTPNDENCDDGDACNGTEECMLVTGCTMPGELNCNDDNVCTDDDCDPATGCVNLEKPCEEDGNVCTSDTCDPVGGCQYQSIQGACDDGNPCTSADTCSGGECNGPFPVICNDDNFCTDDSCDPATGCLFAPNDLNCDDGNPCTLQDTCHHGVCGKSSCCDVNDAAGCDNLGCQNCVCDLDPFCCDTQWDGLCVAEATNECASECGCSEGFELDDCDDGNPCTTDSCLPTVGCVNVHADGLACDDGNACTEGDVCDEGICTSGGDITESCDDNVDCTDDGCNPETGCVAVPFDAFCEDGIACTTNACDEKLGCVASPDGEPCDDGNPCTMDECTPNGCIFTPSDLACDDGAPCTDDVCTPNGCAHIPDDSLCESLTGDADCATTVCLPFQGCTAANVFGKPCDDGNPCTMDDACSKGGECDGEPVTCDDGVECTHEECDPSNGSCFTLTDDQICDDGNDCTLNICEEIVGCTFPPIEDALTGDGGAAGADLSPMDYPCDDGNACTENDACQAGACMPGSEVDCDDGNPCTTDSCLPAVGCVNANDDDIDCDDGNACTENDQCLDGACVGTALECGDDNDCTDDGCDPDSGDCVNANNTEACDDGNPCIVGDVCADGQCVGSLIDCDDGDECTDDGCDPDDGECFNTDISENCEDDVDCTDDGCDPDSGCVNEPIDALCDDGTPCQEFACDQVDGCAVSESGDGAPCFDGDYCTIGDACDAGECQSGVGSIGCDDGNACTLDTCNPAFGTCVFTPVTCDDGDSCTVDECQEDGSCSNEPLTPCEELVQCAPDPEDDGKLVCPIGLIHAKEGIPLATGTQFNLAYDPTKLGNPAFTQFTGHALIIQPQQSESWNGGGSVALAPLGDSTESLNGAVIVSGELLGDPVFMEVCFDLLEESPETTPAVNIGNIVVTDESATFSYTVWVDDGNIMVSDSIPCENDAECDDGNHCNGAETCEQGTCLPGDGDDPLGCDDGNVCNGVEGCDPEETDPTAACTTGEPVVCDDSGNQCTELVCDPDSGACLEKNLDGDVCDDGSECTENDVCSGGTCSGTTTDCDDGVECTIDDCDPSSGCSNLADSASCDDGDECTDDICDLNSGCSNPQNGLCTILCDSDEDCDDSDACTTGTCDLSGAQGECVFEDVICDDGVPCTVESCDPLLGCISMPDDALCDDFKSCTVDMCDAVEGCLNLADQNFCEDAVACTVDTCDPDNPDSIVGSGCIFTPDDSVCTDGVACTVDTCDPDGTFDGTGCIFTPEDSLCGDGTGCSVDVCDPSEGCMTEDIPDGEGCDDGDSCTVDDVCLSGVCGGVPMDCDDGVECTDNLCLNGECSNPLSAAGTACVRNNNCWANAICDGAGMCTGGGFGAPTCDVTSVMCAESTGKCENFGATPGSPVESLPGLCEPVFIEGCCTAHEDCGSGYCSVLPGETSGTCVSAD